MAMILNPMAAFAAAPPGLDSCNVVWTSPSADASGSMPIGNGEVGLNVWVEKGGDLAFYIARTDSWGENCRLLKLGRVRISLSPNPFAEGLRFRQELLLRQGRIAIAAGPPDRQVALTVFVDADRPVIHVTVRGAAPLELTARLDVWRTVRRRLEGAELESAWTLRGAPMEVWESPDVVREDAADRLAWYHRNETSIVPLTVKHQGLGAALFVVEDPLLGRTFGGIVEGRGLARKDARTLVSAAPAREFDVRIAAYAAQAPSADAWMEQAEAVLKAAPAPAAAAEATASWWEAFWGRSWLFLEGADAASNEAAAALTRAYVLQRWVTACGGRGKYPIKFNGSIFTVEPKFVDKKPFDADYRRWGDCHWWQNARLPYQPMLARGDFEMMWPLFDLYAGVLPIGSQRSRIYFGAEGVYFPETMTLFGLYSNGDYGWNREGLEPGDLRHCPWWRWAWNQGPELVMMMLDYWDHTRDEAFLAADLVPMARDVLKFFATRFKRDGKGVLVIEPTQAIETYRSGVVNDMPAVAGLHAILPRLLALPADALPQDVGAAWKALQASLPPVPTRTEGGTTFLLPAEKFEPRRTNSENPELYAVYPFRLFGVGKPGLEVARESFRRRPAKATAGWQQAGMAAALCGLPDDVRDILLKNVANANPNFRFPVMWGPNYDWVPDQDHGSNLMATLQLACLQADGGKIHVFPAWPRQWNVRFRLHAPDRTVVEGVFRGGKVESVRVEPPARRADVVLPP